MPSEATRLFFLQSDAQESYVNAKVGTLFDSETTSKYTLSSSTILSLRRSGGEHDTMFTDVVETSITHVAGDDLERRRISMRPDRVFGLRTPSTVAPNDIHFPAEGREQLLLPFLVVEAKKERGAPGFRSILFQTAFPVRRFLRAQAEIDSRDSLCEPSLVWFFAYQGDIWRLHAGTLDRDKVV